MTMKQHKSDANLKFKILLLKGKIFYMKYVKIAAWAILEILAELYMSKKRDSK